MSDIDSMLLREAIADAKARRQTELAHACGSLDTAFDRSPQMTEEELDKQIEELIKEIPND